VREENIVARDEAKSFGENKMFEFVEARSLEICFACSIATSNGAALLSLFTVLAGQSVPELTKLLSTSNVQATTHVILLLSAFTFLSPFLLAQFLVDPV
jgi:hypothetical protein